MPATYADSVPPSSASSPVTLISRTTLAAATAQVDLTIPSTYPHVAMYWSGRCVNPSSAFACYLRVNNSSAAVYSGSLQSVANGGQPSAIWTNLGTSVRFGVVGNNVSSAAGSGIVELPNWTTTVGSVNLLTRAVYYESSGNSYTENGGYAYVAAGPYTQINLFVASSLNWAAGSTFALYGYS